VLIAVLTRILFVTFFILFVFHLQVDAISPLLLNASLLLVVKEMNDCCLFIVFLLKILTALIFFITINSLTC